MSLLDLIGFIFSFAAFIFFMVKRALDERKRRLHPELYEEEEEFEEAYEVPRSALPPLPPPVPKAPKKKKQSSLSNFQTAKFEDLNPTEASHYEVENKKTPSRVQTLVGRLPARSSMLLIHEIFGPPKGLQ